MRYENKTKLCTIIIIIYRLLALTAKSWIKNNKTMYTIKINAKRAYISNCPDHTLKKTYEI
jgi:hypothetical protein